MGAATKSHFLQALSRLLSLSPPGSLPEPKAIVTLAHSEVEQRNRVGRSNAEDAGDAG